MALRVERHVENGRRVAEFLRQDPRVDWLTYAGFSDSPDHLMAKKYLGKDKYPYSRPGEVRVIYKVEPERITSTT